jgi:nucleotide-binding universal stress UspA family protein
MKPAIQVVTPRGGYAMRRTIDRILVPTDFSTTADAALDYARVLAARFGAELRLLHVLEDQYLGGSFAGEVYIPEPSNLRAALTKEAEALLAKRVAPLRRESLQVDAAVVVGRSFRAIVDHADEYGADLIVMGTHGRTGIPHLLLGSVAERIVRTATCPVLTVRETPVPATEPAIAQAMVSTVV